MSGVTRDYYAGHQRGLADGEERAIERIIKLVERFGFNEELGFSFEQAKEDLLTLIKGEQTESKSVARRVKIQKGESAKGSVEPAQLEVLIKGEK